MAKLHLSNLDLLARKLKVFLVLEENLCCGYTLEVPHGGTSNVYPQHKFFL